MIQLQIISKVLATKDYSIIVDNMLDESYFVGYEDEYNFIKTHFEKYNNVPDRATFLASFPNIDLVDVSESDDYLIDTIREEHLYYETVPIVQKVAELLQSDSNKAAEYLLQIAPTLQPTYRIGGVNIITDSQKRYNEYISKQDNEDDWMFTTGFSELDTMIHGISRQEELMVIFARTNQGKSWLLAKICTHVWQLGFNVGYISPEMSSTNIGYRFDTLYKNFSNTGLMYPSNNNVNSEQYKDYIDSLKDNKNKFIVSTPIDFGKKITVSKVRNYIKQYNLNLVAIDGITYMTDERYKRGDSKTITLTNISEDLISLSMELKVPILVVVQANRGGVIDKDTEGTPELENIRDSDGIAQNATKVISIKQKDDILEIGNKKQRFGKIGGILKYHWNVDTGDYIYIPSNGDAMPVSETHEKVHRLRRKYTDSTDVF